MSRQLAFDFDFHRITETIDGIERTASRSRALALARNLILFYREPRPLNDSASCPPDIYHLARSLIGLTILSFPRLPRTV